MQLKLETLPISKVTKSKLAVASEKLISRDLFATKIATAKESLKNVVLPFNMNL